MERNSIWYVDDDVDDQFYFESALESIPYKVNLKTFTNPKNFVDNLGEVNPANSIVFLDINMMPMSGFQVLEHIRSTQSLKDMPVVMYSTSGDEKTIKISEELGASAYAVKPDRIQKLTQTLSEILSNDWAKPGGKDFAVYN